MQKFFRLLEVKNTGDIHDCGYYATEDECVAEINRRIESYRECIVSLPVEYEVRTIYRW